MRSRFCGAPFAVPSCQGRLDGYQVRDAGFAPTRGRGPWPGASLGSLDCDWVGAPRPVYPAVGAADIPRGWRCPTPVSVYTTLQVLAKFADT